MAYNHPHCISPASKMPAVRSKHSGHIGLISLLQRILTSAAYCLYLVVGPADLLLGRDVYCRINLI